MEHKLKQLKNKYKNIRYFDKYRCCNSNMYDVIKSAFYFIQKHNRLLKSIYYIDIFNSLEHKTLNNYIDEVNRAVKNHKNKQMINEFDRLVSLIHTEFNDLELNDIKNICEVCYYLNNFEGFLLEHLIIKYLEANDFNVYHNDVLDNNYKIDILLNHKYINPNKAIAIQSKSNTYLKISDYEKNIHINGMNEFKNNGYKDFNFKDDIKIDEVKPYYILHNDLDLNCYENNILIPIDEIKNVYGVDRDLKNQYGKPYDVYINKSINDLLEEINGILEIN
ncbi:MAG: hypothetical protein IJ086_14095 [Clostridium sp.]|nr:hypothetical protein [Clostridium sp.]